MTAIEKTAYNVALAIAGPGASGARINRVAVMLAERLSFLELNQLAMLYLAGRKQESHHV